MTVPAPSRKNEQALLPSESIRRAVERLAFQANRAAKAPRPDAVHDLRVAARRAEQALVTFKAYVPRKPLKRIRKQLKAILACAGVLRDCDIAGKIFARTRQPGTAALLGRIRAQRKDAAKALLTQLKHLSPRTRMSRWYDDLKLSAPRSDFHADMLPGLAEETLTRLAQRFFRAGASASADSCVKTLHDFRIRAKKFRYALELFVPIYGAAAAEWTREIKSVQAVLGAMNDYRTALSMASESGCSDKLKASLKKAERRKIRQFRALWDERFSNSAAAWLPALRLRGQESVIPRKPITAIAPETPRAAAASA